MLEEHLSFHTATDPPCAPPTKWGIFDVGVGVVVELSGAPLVKLPVQRAQQRESKVSCVHNGQLRSRGQKTTDVRDSTVNYSTVLSEVAVTFDTSWRDRDI